MADLPNLPELEAEWAIFMENRSGPRGQWTQDQRWRADNPVELQALVTYREGGARPTLVTEPGRRMVAHLDAWHKAKGEDEPPPPPPPPDGVLRWSPPTGWNGNDPTQGASFPTYQQITLTGGAQSLTLDDNIDYYLQLDTKNFRSGDNSGSGRSLGLHINGGRNVVLIGGAILFEHTSRNDSAGILVDRGNPNGKVFIEGVHIDAVNDIVLRTAREVYIQNCRLLATKRLASGAGTDLHSDCLQIWGAEYHPSVLPCKGIFMDKVSMFIDFTAIVPSIEVNHDASRGFPMVDPLKFHRWRCDFHPRYPDKIIALYEYPCSGLTASVTNNGPYPEKVGESWAEPSMHPGGYERKIDDVVIARDLSPVFVTFPYEIKNPAGQNLYVSPPGNVGGNAPYNIAGKAGIGNYLTFDREPKFAGFKWYIGTPPASKGAVNGQFCPDGVAGANYRPVGYA